MVHLSPDEIFFMARIYNSEIAFGTQWLSPWYFTPLTVKGIDDITELLDALFDKKLLNRRYFDVGSGYQLNGDGQDWYMEYERRDL